MKYVIQLFSLLCFSMLTTVSMAQNEMFDDLFNQMKVNSERDDTGGGGGSGLSGPVGGAGGGGNDSIIGIEWSGETAVLGDDYTITWEPVKGKDTYVVQVAEEKRRGDLNLIYVAKVKANSSVLPFGNLDLDDQKTYYVRVTSADGAAISKKGLINRVDDNVYQSALKAVKEDPRYKSGSKLDKIMMKAWALERSNLIMDAYKYYNKYLPKPEDDTVLRNMKEIFVKKHR